MFGNILKGKNPFADWENALSFKKGPRSLRRRMTDPVIRDIDGIYVQSKDYVNVNTKLEVECPKGHIFKVSWNNFKNSSSRCPICANIRRRKPTKEVKKFVENQGYRFILSEFEKGQTKIRVQCSKGHSYKTTWSSFQQGGRCSICAGNKKKTFEEIREYIESQGYKCISDKYKDISTNLKVRCTRGHEYETTWINFFYTGSRCQICHYSNILGPNNPNWRGGISAEPYCFIWDNKEFKEMILERDKHKCMNPLCRIGNSLRLCKHHIDYNKKNCGLKNVIILCNSCNSRANSNRAEWKSFYQNILSQKFNYQYK